MKRWWLSLGLALSLPSCRIEVDRPPQFEPALESLDPESGDHLFKTRPVLLVSDCQFQNLESRPIAERNLTAQSLFSTVIRPPQLDMFSRDVLTWILEESGDPGEPVIHLGDACNLSCDGELLRFFDVLTGSERPWLMVPGNHDGYYFGNFQPWRREIWEDACSGSGGPLTKDGFIRAYVATLIGEDRADCRALARALEPWTLEADDVAAGLPEQFEWENEGEGFLQAIAWHLDTERPWRSFVIQRASLEDGEGRGCSAILLDSCQYTERPAVIPNAWATLPLQLNTGYTGELLADQLRLCRRWTEELAASGGIAVLMSHHPLDSIAVRSQSALRWLWSHEPVAVYVSAHTHNGHFEHQELAGGRSGVELNIGSTTDWPMSWRSLQLLSGSEHEVYLRSERFTLAEELQQHGEYFLREWEIPADAADDYRAFHQGEASPGFIEDYLLWYHLWPRAFGHPWVGPTPQAVFTETRVKDTVLGIHARLLQAFPTDLEAEAAQWPGGCRSDADVHARIEACLSEEATLNDKTSLMQELDRFERSRTTADPSTGASLDEARQRYKLSQAVWASRFEKLGGRSLSVDDQLIRFLIPGLPR